MLRPHIRSHAARGSKQAVVQLDLNRQPAPQPAPAGCGGSSYPVMHVHPMLSSLHPRLCRVETLLLVLRQSVSVPAVPSSVYSCTVVSVLLVKDRSLYSSVVLSAYTVPVVRTGSIVSAITSNRNTILAHGLHPVCGCTPRSCRGVCCSRKQKKDVLAV